jgi:hypothetical protein
MRKWGITGPAGAVLAAGSLTVLAGVVPAHAAVPVIRITFDGGSSGSAPVAVSIARSGGGTVSTMSDKPWLGRTGRTPSFDPDPGAPRGVLKVAATSGDPLSPGSQTFTFGADVLLDAGTTGVHRTGSTDNGDNVVQRGLYGQQSQYKIQVDGRRPSCRVKGRGGAVTVWSTTTLAAGTWYGLRCTRSGKTVSLQVRRYSSTGAVVSTTTTKRRGATGSVSAPRSVPISVGGKLTSDGQVAHDSDQFNGRVDNVVLSIG